MKIDYLSYIKNEKPYRGYYNNNYICEVNNKKVLVRIPIENSDEMDLKIVPEEEILDFLNNYDLSIPKLIYLSKDPKYQVHSFINGEVVNNKYPRGSILPDSFIPQTIKLIMKLWNIKEFPLINYFKNWPKNGDVNGFFNILVNNLKEIYERDVEEFSGLYAQLGIPSDPFKEIVKLSNTMKSRDFVICHSDMHRKNCIIDNDKVYYLDWELALFADPAYEIAVHMHKISYTKDEEYRFRSMINDILIYDKEEFWNDVLTYLKLEKIKSAIVDAIRYYKQIKFDNITDEEVDNLMKKYSIKLEETKSIWNNMVLSSDEILLILKNY